MRLQQPGTELAPATRNLHQLIRLAADNSMATAVKRNSFIVNEVPREFQIETDEKLLEPILNTLIGTVVSHTKHSCICIKAKRFEDIICVFIRENSAFGDFSVTENMKLVKLLAKTMNGSVSIRNMEDKFTTILLSFPNFPKAA